jgi:hypothetical protein
VVVEILKDHGDPTPRIGGCTIVAGNFIGPSGEGKVVGELWENIKNWRQN